MGKKELLKQLIAGFQAPLSVEVRPSVDNQSACCS